MVKLIFMNKYLILFQKAFIKAIEYRSEIAVWLILDILPTLILLLVWVGIYQGKDDIAGFGLSQMLQYYLLGLIIEGLTASHFEAWRIEQIKMGKIDYFLTRPLSFITEIIIVHFGGKFLYLFVSLPVFIIIWIFTNLFLPVGIPEITLNTLAIFTFFLLASSIFQTLVTLIIVLLGFWFEGAQGLEHFKWITLTIFSGLMIPIQLMPIWMKAIVNFLPFKYLYAVPIGIIQNTYQLKIFDLVYLISTVIVLLTMNLLIWEKAKYQYGSAGG